MIVLLLLPQYATCLRAVSRTAQPTKSAWMFLNRAKPFLSQEYTAMVPAIGRTAHKLCVMKQQLSAFCKRQATQTLVSRQKKLAVPGVFAYIHRSG